MNVSPSIFRLYDIRGVAGKDFSQTAIAEYERWYGAFPGVNITLEVAEHIGKAYGTLMVRRYGAQTILVGHESRPFADELTAAFISGVRSTGCNVTDAGIALTPIVYFGDAVYHYDGAVNVTGSHNVSFYNGFKMMGKDVNPVFGDELQVIRRMIEKEDFLAATPGKIDQRNVYPDYERYATDHIALARPMKIVVDTGNGSAGLFAESFFRALGCEVISLYQKVDATFPNHVPDPEEPSSLIELGQQVVQHNADLGIGLDADGDRVGCVDEKGDYVDADYLLLALSRDVLSRHPGKTILYDVKCSRLMEELIPSYGGKPIMHQTGHAPIKRSMRKNPNIILAGEVSGHIFFSEDYFKFDDGLFAAARILELASKQRGSFSSLFSDIPTTIRTSELKLPCRDEEKFLIVEALKKTFAARYKTILIDGVRVVYDPTSWFLVRASNTNPYLAIRLEADSEKRLLEMKNVLADELEKHPGITDRLNRNAVTTKTGHLGWV
ncbi:MAG: phosphomannomutase/phosphoglucomutase [bacterium]